MECSLAALDDQYLCYPIMHCAAMLRRYEGSFSVTISLLLIGSTELSDELFS